MLIKRIAAAIVGMPLLLGLIYYGRLPFMLLVLVMTFLGLKEFYNFMVEKKLSVPKNLFFFNGLLFVVLSSLPQKNYTWLAAYLTYVILSLLLAKIFQNEVEDSIINIGAGFLGIFYVGWLNAHFIYLRSIEDGFFYILLCFLTIWMNDSSAFFLGIRFGKHKLCPKISPKKSWEGAIAGLVFSCLTAGVAGFIMSSHMDRPLGLVHFLILGALISIIGQLGDAAESIFKRDAGVKDSSNLIPGHGGILDRFDSLLFAVPVVYYYVQFILG